MTGHRLWRARRERRTPLHRAGRVILSAATAVVLTVSLLSGSSLAQVGRAHPQASPVVMTWAESADLVSIDPAIANVDMDFTVTRNVYEGLTTYRTSDLKVLPSLATDWTGSGTTWTFHLRPNVKFTDGTTFSATDVKASIDRTLKLNQGEAYLISDIADVQIVNPLTVRITTQQPDVYLPANLSHIGIVSSAAITAHAVNGDLAKAWFAAHTDGTGPYTLDSWTHGSQLVLVKNPGWWRGWQPGTVDRFIDAIVPTVSTRVQGVQGGQYAMGNYLPVADALRISKLPGFKVVTGYENFSFPAIYLNTQVAPTDNLNLRKALVLSFDYAAMRGFYQGRATTPRGPIPSFIPDSGEDRLPARQEDLTAAKAALAASGVKNAGITCAVPIGFAEFSFAATLFQADAQKLGVAVQLNNMPFPQFIAAVQANKVACSILGEANLSPDPTQFFASHYLTGAYYNLAHYTNPQFDALVKKIRQTFNHAARAELLFQASKMIAEDYTVILAARPQLVWVMPSYVNGFTVDPTDYHIIRIYDIRIASH